MRFYKTSEGVWINPTHVVCLSPIEEEKTLITTINDDITDNKPILTVLKGITRNTTSRRVYESSSIKGPGFGQTTGNGNGN